MSSRAYERSREELSLSHVEIEQRLPVILRGSQSCRKTTVSTFTVFSCLRRERRKVVYRQRTIVQGELENKRTDVEVENFSVQNVCVGRPVKFNNEKKSFILM